MLYRASGVDSITDYNGFLPCRSREGDRVYLTFSFNCIIYLIFILVFCRLSVH